jgi:hypothetical protein
MIVILNLLLLILYIVITIYKELIKDFIEVYIFKNKKELRQKFSEIRRGSNFDLQQAVKILRDSKPTSNYTNVYYYHDTNVYQFGKIESYTIGYVVTCVTLTMLYTINKCLTLWRFN